MIESNQAKISYFRISNPFRTVCFFVWAILFLSHSLFALDPVIILLGPPGAGKGTFAQHLKEKFGYNHISLGDTLRREVEMQTELGCEIQEFVKRGDYIDPKIILALFAKIIVQCQAEGKPFILDAFGQNNGDFEVMQKSIEKAGLLSNTFVMFLEASDSICQERILNRSVCSGCGHVYNAITAKPSVSGWCDLCGMALKARLNDTPQVVLKRLRRYRDGVESNYKAALPLFPSIIYNSNGPLEECILFYDCLAIAAANCDGEACAFVEDFLGQAAR